MSNEDDLDNDDDLDNNEGGENKNAPKALRQQNSKLNKALEEANAKAAELEKRLRRIDIADALEQHGAHKKLAKYVDVEDASPEAVLKWLEENGEDFGWSPDDTEDEDEQDRQSQARRISQATREAPASRAPVVTPEFIKTAPRADLIAAGVLKSE